MTGGIATRLTAVMVTGIVSVLAAVPSDPLSSFAPDGFLDAKKQADLSAGAAVVDVLPARGGDISVVGAAKIRVGNERLATWMRQIEDLQRGPYVPIAVRFSDPPRLEDLDRLVLDRSDLDDIRDCERGDCGLKLSGDEIDRLRRRERRRDPQELLPRLGRHDVALIGGDGRREGRFGEFDGRWCSRLIGSDDRKRGNCSDCKSRQE